MTLEEQVAYLQVEVTLLWKAIEEPSEVPSTLLNLIVKNKEAIKLNNKKEK